MSFKLVELSNLLEYQKEYIIINDEEEYKRCTAKLHRQGIVLRDIIKGRDIKTKKQQVCKSGQLLVAEIDAKVGGYGIVPSELEGAIVSSHYFLFNIKEDKLNRLYLHYFLKTDDFFNQIKPQGTTNYASIRPRDVLKIKIQLPSLKRQKEVAEKLDRFFKNQELLNKQNENNVEILNKLRQSILQEAVQGKLVPQDPNDEPASILLERIKEEKERLIKEGKIKKQKPLSPITEDEIPYELPKGWKWVRLGEIGDINPRNDIDDDLKVSFVPMRLIKDGFSNKHSSEIKKWKDIKKGYTHFRENDVVIAKITPCFQNRKSAVMKNLANGFGAGTTELFVIRSYANCVAPEYFLILFKTESFIQGGVATYTGTAGQQRVKKNYIVNLPFPLPPLNEQKRIVEKVGQLMALCDELEKNIEQSKKDSELLVQSVLQEVFKEV